MKNAFLPVVLALSVTACGSSDNPVVEPPGENSTGGIVIGDAPREALAPIPSVSFNGQYETTARPELGVGGSSTGGDGVTLSAPEADVSDSVASEGVDRIPGPTFPGQTIQPGTLTAGDYDDQLNPSFYQHYASEYLQRRGQWIDVPRLDFNQRIRIEVTDQSGLPYADAKVEITGANAQSVVTLHTPANGITALYNNIESLPASFTLRATGTDSTTVQQDISRQAAIDSGELLVTLARDNQSQSAAAAPVDLMFVIDTTGSMSDELLFLQTELSDIINAVTRQQADIKIGLVFYRDYGDEYVVRAHGFSGDMNSVQLNLNQEFASGGGDYPEAMDQALQTALGADWRDNSRKVLFLVADAPPHSDRMRATWTAAEQARLKNIHMVPVAASGVGEDAEYIMRSTAALTNSRYLFLTDDSGFGLSHAEPEIDCYVVTSLRGTMIRALNSLITGTRDEPSANDIVRQVGEYNDGVCTPDDSVGNTVAYSVIVERSNGGVAGKKTEVITDQQSLNEALASYGEPTVDVDFNAGQIILIDVGPRTTGGYSAGIASIEDNDDHVLANVVFRYPGINCAVTQALTHPFSFIYVETQKALRIVENTVSPECSF